VVTFASEVLVRSGIDRAAQALAASGRDAHRTAGATPALHIAAPASWSGFFL